MNNGLFWMRVIEFIRSITIPLVLKTILLFVIVTWGTFTIMRILPEKRTIAAEEEFATVGRADAGYIAWLSDILTGDFGYSDYFKGQRIQSQIFRYFTTTLTLCIITLIISGGAGIITGILQAQGRTPYLNHANMKSYKYITSGLTFLVYFLSSFPAYIIAYIIFFATKSQINIFYAILSLVLGSGLTMDIMRSTSTSMKEELSKPYIVNALGLGLRTTGWLPFPGQVSNHAFRNIVVVILPVISAKLPMIISGAIVVELVFELPGLSEPLLGGIINRDFHLVLAVVTLSVLFIQITTLAIEFLAFALSPFKYSLD